jgi:hypothetical protein
LVLCMRRHKPTTSPACCGPTCSTWSPWPMRWSSADASCGSSPTPAPTRPWTRTSRPVSAPTWRASSGRAYYHCLGRVWRRSYLLYAPQHRQGGKSMFAAAMARFPGTLTSTCPAPLPAAMTSVRCSCTPPCACSSSSRTWAGTCREAAGMGRRARPGCCASWTASRRAARGVWHGVHHAWGRGVREGKRTGRLFFGLRR